MQEVKWLIAAGTDLEQRHRYSTSLEWAIGYGRVEIVKELLDAGAKIYAANLLEQITCQISCNETSEEHHIHILDILVQAGMSSSLLHITLI